MLDENGEIVNRSLFALAMFFLLLLTACTNNLSTPLRTSTNNGVATIVVSTHTIVSSPTSAQASTETQSPTHTMFSTSSWLIWPPNKQKEEAQTLYQLEFDPSQWEIVNDSSASFYGTIRNEQYLVSKVMVGCAIIHTVGSETLSSYPREKFLWLIYSIPVTFDRSQYNIFIVGMGHPPGCLASGKQVLSTLQEIRTNDVVPTP